MSTAEKPLPAIIASEKPYWDYARRHELRVQRCGHCAALRYPASPICPDCGRGEHVWARMSGRGKVLSWVVFHRAYFDGFADDLPYNVAMVALEEGPVLISAVEEIDNADLRKGLPVEAVFEDRTPEISILKFRPIRHARRTQSGSREATLVQERQNGREA